MNSNSKVRYGFSRRTDGNMSYNSNKKDKVSSNRINFLTSLKLSSHKLITVSQVHGNSIYKVDIDYEERLSNTVKADAIITDRIDIAIGVLTADCLPVVIFDSKAKGVGVIHAGRIGSSKLITYLTLRKFIDNFALNPETIFTVLGPCIGKCCYEVGEEALSPFREQIKDLTKIAYPVDNYKDKWMLDISAINVIQILEAGISPANIIRIDRCTLCSKEYYSYRGEHTPHRFINIAALIK